MAAAPHIAPLALLLEGAWAIREESLESLRASLLSNGTPEALAREIGRPLDNRRSVELRGSVAVVRVEGPLFLSSCWFTSYEQLALDINRVVADGAVSAIVLDINSPGGQSLGLTELADQIAEARARKPIVAYVGGQACSAAYVLAAACTRIVADESGLVGSLGCCMTVASAQRMYEAMGIDQRMVVSAVSPLKNLVAQKGLTEESLSDAQRLVNALGEVLVDKVASYRGMETKDVAARYGRGAIVVAGKGGLAAGLVDAIGSLESVLGELGQQSRSRSGNTPEGNQSMKAIAQSLGLPDSATEQEIQAAIAANTARANAAEARLRDAEAARFKAQVEALIDQGRNEGRIVPATEQMYREMCADSAGYELLKANLPKMPVVGAPSGLDKRRPPTTETQPGVLAEDDATWCRENGINPQEFLAVRDDPTVQRKFRRGARSMFKDGETTEDGE